MSDYHTKLSTNLLKNDTNYNLLLMFSEEESIAHYIANK